MILSFRSGIRITSSPSRRIAKLALDLAVLSCILAGYGEWNIKLSTTMRSHKGALAKIFPAGVQGRHAPASSHRTPVGVLDVMLAPPRHSINFLIRRGGL